MARLPVFLQPPSSQPSYGGDEAGLICGYLFGAGHGAHELDSAAAAEWLAQPGANGQTFTWLHFNLSHTQAERWLARHAALPPAFFEALHDGLHSTRIERAGSTLLAVINDVHFEFSFEPSDIATLWIAVGPRLVVTARTKALRSVDALRIAVRRGELPTSAGRLLEQLMRSQADVLVQIVREVTSRVDDIEDSLLARRVDRQRARLGSLRRVLVRLQRLLAPEPAALFRLLQDPPAWMGEADAQALRASSEEFSVALRDMAALQERIKLLQEEIAAIVGEENNRSLFTLTVVTVLALPINLTAGLLGMNVGGVPLAQHPHGFWVVVAVVLGFTGAAAWWALRRRGKD